jgi:hypothetical protein
VVREHGDPCGYAEELVGFAQVQGRATGAVVCFMAGSSRLGRRVASILDPTRSRRALPRAASIGTLLCTAIAVTAIGSFGWSAPREAPVPGGSVDSSSRRYWFGYWVDLGLRETTIFRRDVVVSELPALVEPTYSSLYVVVELEKPRHGKGRVLEVQASNAPRVLDARGASIYWLGPTRKEESLAMLRELQDMATGEPRRTIRSLLDFHAAQEKR